MQFYAVNSEVVNSDESKLYPFAFLLFTSLSFILNPLSLPPGRCHSDKHLKGG